MARIFDGQAVAPVSTSRRKKFQFWLRRDTVYCRELAGGASKLKGRATGRIVTPDICVVSLRETRGGEGGP